MKAIGRTDFQTPDPWGHKITYHVYIEGDRDKLDLEGRIKAINEAIPDAHFIGMDVRPVQDEPKDQIAT